MDMKLEKMIQELLARIETLERENARLKDEKILMILIRPMLRKLNES